jgi:hypothetical protein
VFEPINVAIYNDGVPSMTLVSEEEISEILHGIQDEALDEGFPPTAEEAYEMEAAVTFVEFMSWLAHLEEREEQARTSFNHVQKRWEARRSEGLIGRPRPAKAFGEQQIRRQHHLPKSINCQALVTHTHRHMEFKMRHQDTARHREQPRVKKMQNSHMYRPPIIQPRKQN